MQQQCKKWTENVEEKQKKFFVVPWKMFFHLKHILFQTNKNPLTIVCDNWVLKA